MDAGPPGCESAPAKTLIAPLIGLLSSTLLLPFLVPSPVPGNVPPAIALVRSAEAIVLVAVVSTLASAIILFRLRHLPVNAVPGQPLLLTAAAAVWLVPLA